MFQSITVLVFGLTYLAALFAVATWGDRQENKRPPGTPRPYIYALSLAVYCTSWTYFGSVGIAANAGLDFLPIYIGPILFFIFGWRVLQMIADLAKRHNVTSIADFMAARYGKSEVLGIIVTFVAVIGIVPYISIQLKAVSASISAIFTYSSIPEMLMAGLQRADTISILVAVTMGAFAILFGTRHIDNTEHQDGMILAIAVESIVKLVAFVAVGLFVTLWMAGGPGKLAQAVGNNEELQTLFTKDLQGGRWLALTLLASLAIVLLPRQFHVSVVENAHPSDIRRARWLFPLYLIAINLFVIPIALAGRLMLPPGVDSDMYVLALPATAQSEFFTMIAFIGGLSASTAMVIVETIALAIMLCNNVVVPLMLRRAMDEKQDASAGVGGILVLVRRFSILAILALAYSYYRMIGSTAALAQVGLISFAAVVQFAPAFFGAMIWRRATAIGAMAGITAGTLVWFYTLFLPSFVDAGWIPTSLIDDGPWGLALLRPRMLFNIQFDPLSHGVFWSLIANFACYIGFSLMRPPTAIERIQAGSFTSREQAPGLGSGFRLWRTSVSAEQLEETVASYLGQPRTRVAFAEHFAQRGQTHQPHDVDVQTLRFAEHLLARAVGVASSRLVMALLLRRNSAQPLGALRLLDDASVAIQQNRDLLQTAIDNVEQGIAVFDTELNLTCWNASFVSFLEINHELERVGAPLSEVLRDFLSRTACPPPAIDARIAAVASGLNPFRETLQKRLRVLEVRSQTIPGGGIVVTFADVTDSVRSAEALQKSNEELEHRVEERTRELMQLNVALEQARAEAEAANLGKTKFIAAASHDILQPLNAARLFTSSLVEKLRQSPSGALARNVDASLESVEEILSALLDMSRLDANALVPELHQIRIDVLLQSLQTEYAPAAAKRGLQLKTLPCSLAVETDRKLLRRVLQNFISNAIKYTRSGRILVGCRRRGNMLRIEVHDTGIGISSEQQNLVFEEFRRLGGDDIVAPGLGLGLSIVRRIAEILGSGITLQSQPGKGSMFAVEVPISISPAPKLPEAPRRRLAAGLGNLSHVLVIDNEKAIVEGMRSLLESWGLKPHGAMTPAGALRISADLGTSLDIILADYHLDESDGISLIAELRRKSRRNIPAILITADRSPEVADKALAHDIHLLRKPVRPASLRAAMAHMQSRISA